MANFRNLLKGSSLTGILTSVIGMVAGKVVADKMQRKTLKEQTGFETTEEIMADAQAKAAKAQAEAEAQAAKAQAQAQAQSKADGEA